MLSANEKQSISVFLFNAGHANVRFVGKHVVYLDQTKGQRAMDKLIDPNDILDHVRDLSLFALDKLMVKLVMQQVDPSKEIWSRWGEWDSLPDQIYEMSHWTNNPVKLLQLLKDDVFEDRTRITAFA